jgi:death on curing protein
MLVDEILYIDIETAIAKHDEIIQKTGGLPGILHQGVLESALQHIQNDDYYPSFVDKLTHIVDQINRQVFADGSKRSSITVGAYFLEINNFDQAVVGMFMREMENPVLLAAQNKLDAEDLKAIINDVIYHLEISEETKMRYLMLLE